MGTRIRRRSFSTPGVATAVVCGVLSAHVMTGCRTIGKQTGETAPARWPVFAVPRMGSVVVDGDITDWADGGFRVDALITDRGSEPGQGPMPARDDCSAAMRLGWNDAGLLVLLDVTGSDWRESDKLTDLYDGDSVELYLAPRPGGPDRCQWLVAPGMDAGFPDPRAYLQPFGTTPRLQRSGIVPDVARRRTDTGYVMELLLPWSALELTPGPGVEAAFQVMVNSNPRNGRDSAHLLWFPVLGAAHDGRKVHRILLAVEPDPPVIARASVHADLRASKTECEVFAPASAAGQEVVLRSSAGVLAVGKLGVDAGGYARATLAGPGTDDQTVYLDLAGRRSDAVPLGLPRAEMAIETRVRWESSASGPVVVLGLPDAPAPGYRIARRLPGREWQVQAKEAPPGEFRDTTVTNGTVYEYGVIRAGDAPLTDYFWAGHEIPVRDRRGTVLLLIERSQIEPLAAEIRRLTLDLVGDGWQVSRHDVSATQTPTEIRQLIRAEYDRAPAEVSTVLLLGHVPVAYAGNRRPDGHGGGAWPADVYYGALTGVWSDEAPNGGGRGRRNEGPADGKFDQDTIPGTVQLAVGRIDFANMPTFGVDETTLLRRYLDRDHAYRHARLAVADRALIHDNFLGHRERFSYSGWQNFTTLLDPAEVRTVTWPNIRPDMNLFFYACGPGHPGSMQGFGSTSDLVKTPLGGVFTLLFGSIFGEWDRSDNLMRAALAHERGALTCGWGGRPQWYLHPLGMGETIGDCLRLTQNNDGSDYQPVGDFARGVHIALMGDPTLRLHRVAPPADLRVNAARRGVRLSWTVSAGEVAGYHVYRAADEMGPYERLTALPVTALHVDDPDGTSERHYQVRAVVLQRSTTGTYYNNSQGVFAGPSPATGTQSPGVVARGMD